MHKIDIKEAETRLTELIDEAASGEEVIITRGDGASFKLVLIGEPGPHPTFGSAKGLVEMADDFDEPLDDFDAYTS